VFIASSFVFASQFVVEKKKRVPVKTLQETALNKAIFLMKKIPSLQRSLADLQEKMQEIFIKCADGDKTVIFASKKVELLEREINSIETLLSTFEKLDEAVDHYCAK